MYKVFTMYLLLKILREKQRSTEEKEDKQEASEVLLRKKEKGIRSLQLRSTVQISYII